MLDGADVAPRAVLHLDQRIGGGDVHRCSRWHRCGAQCIPARVPQDGATIPGRRAHRHRVDAGNRVQRPHVHATLLHVDVGHIGCDAVDGGLRARAAALAYLIDTIPQALHHLCIRGRGDHRAKHAWPILAPDQTVSRSDHLKVHVDRDQGPLQGDVADFLRLPYAIHGDPLPHHTHTRCTKEFLRRPRGGRYRTPRSKQDVTLPAVVRQQQHKAQRHLLQCSHAARVDVVRGALNVADSPIAPRRFVVHRDRRVLSRLRAP